jgi:hypothetical protein
MQARLRSRRSTGVVLLSAAMALAVTSACGRSSNAPVGGGGTTSAPSAATTTSASAGVGDIGTLKGICGPGTAKGATARGVTDSEIHIGTTADPGAAAAPGLEQEFFDTGDAFTKWCNAAGGINGRKIVLDKWDAKLFEVAAQIVNACQKDFMLVGNGNAFDSAGVKQRLACNLGQIPSYTVSPEAAKAGQQVNVVPSNPTQYPYGPLRLLTAAYPDTKKGGIGIGSSTIASLTPLGKRIQQALTADGVKVTALQEKPALVDNFRPYMEQLKAAGTVGYDEIQGQDPTPEVQAMNNVGWKPQWILYSVQFYTPQSVQAAAAASTPFPASYVGFSHLPFELSSDPKYPVLNEIKTQLKAAVKNPRFTDFTASSYSAWMLWAQSATACGSTLTEACVLAKAGAHTDWTGGGLYPPTNTSPANPQVTQCWLVVRLTPTGWVYDKKVTNPNSDVYNCDPKNVATVNTFQTTS